MHVVNASVDVDAWNGDDMCWSCAVGVQADTGHNTPRSDNIWNIESARNVLVEIKRRLL